MKVQTDHKLVKMHTSVYFYTCIGNHVEISMEQNVVQ